MGVAYMDTGHKTNGYLDKRSTGTPRGNPPPNKYPDPYQKSLGTTHISNRHDNYHMYYNQNMFHL